MKKQLAAIIAISTTALLTPAAHAVTATVLLPEGVSSSTSDLFDSDVFNLIGGSYFSSSYIPGENNFETFVVNTTYRTFGVDAWVGSTVQPVTLTFDLGEVVTIEGFALWNYSLSG